MASIRKSPYGNVVQKTKNKKKLVEHLDVCEPWNHNKGKNDFEKVFFNSMNYAVAGKARKNVGIHGHIKLEANTKKNHLVAEPNYRIIIYS